MSLTFFFFKKKYISDTPPKKKRPDHQLWYLFLLIISNKSLLFLLSLSQLTIHSYYSSTFDPFLSWPSKSLPPPKNKNKKQSTKRKREERMNSSHPIHYNELHYHQVLDLMVNKASSSAWNQTALLLDQHPQSPSDDDTQDQNWIYPLPSSRSSFDSQSDAQIHQALPHSVYLSEPDPSSRLQSFQPPSLSSQFYSPSHPPIHSTPSEPYTPSFQTDGSSDLSISQLKGYLPLYHHHPIQSIPPPSSSHQLSIPPLISHPPSQVELDIHSQTQALKPDLSSSTRPPSLLSHFTPQHSHSHPFEASCDWFQQHDVSSSSTWTASRPLKPVSDSRSSIAAHHHHHSSDHHQIMDTDDALPDLCSSRQEARLRSTPLDALQAGSGLRAWDGLGTGLTRDWIPHLSPRSMYEGGGGWPGSASAQAQASIRTMMRSSSSASSSSASSSALPLEPHRTSLRSGGALEPESRKAGAGTGSMTEPIKIPCVPASVFDPLVALPLDSGLNTSLGGVQHQDQNLKRASLLISDLKPHSPKRKRVHV